MRDPVVSIVINNHNYATFLARAIESALNQTYDRVDVVVVDDGSSDDSREVIDRFGSRITPIFKTNGGQASALNAGVAASRGDIVCLLDADDVCFPHRASRVVDVVRALDDSPALVHHAMLCIDADDRPLPHPPMRSPHPAALNLYPYAKKYRYLYHVAGPTSALALTRRLVDRIFPLPNDATISADDPLTRAASLVGELYFLDVAAGGYRIHATNRWYHTRNWTSPEFVALTEQYLNTTLVANGREPILAFHDSMYEWRELAQRHAWSRLAKQILRLAARQHDWHTASFVYGMVRFAGAEILRSVGVLQTEARLSGKADS
jgi:glycosyltransferase involved in cell wall biosynthesis